MIYNIHLEYPKSLFITYVDDKSPKSLSWPVWHLAPQSFLESWLEFSKGGLCSTCQFPEHSSLPLDMWHTALTESFNFCLNCPRGNTIRMPNPGITKNKWISEWARCTFWSRNLWHGVVGLNFWPYRIPDVTRVSVHSLEWQRLKVCMLYTFTAN